MAGNCLNHGVEIGKSAFYVQGEDDIRKRFHKGAVFPFTFLQLYFDFLLSG